MSEDPELESFLRRFRPRPPALLRLGGRRLRPHRWVLPIAAVALLATAIWRWLPEPEAGSAPRAATRASAVTLGALNAAARAGRHESLLDEWNVRVLPDATRSDSALRALADVSRDLAPRAGR